MELVFKEDDIATSQWVAIAQIPDASVASFSGPTGVVSPGTMVERRGDGKQSELQVIWVLATGIFGWEPNTNIIEESKEPISKVDFEEIWSPETLTRNMCSFMGSRNCYPETQTEFHVCQHLIENLFLAK